jgi:hypothetical protein
VDAGEEGSLLHPMTGELLHGDDFDGDECKEADDFIGG